MLLKSYICCIYFNIFTACIFIYCMHRYLMFNCEKIRDKRAFRLKGNITTRDLYLYLDNPPAVCNSIKQLGGKLLLVPPGYTYAIDGQKMVCLDPAPTIPRNDCIVYSFGSNNEVSFEIAAYKEFHCKTYIFDPSTTLRKKFQLKQKMKFLKLGIDTHNHEINGWKMMSFKGIKMMLGHAGKVINILKIDIESIEWRVIDSLIGSNELQLVDHLCVEIHMTNITENMKILQRLESIGFQLFSSIRNPKVKQSFITELRYHRPTLYELAFYKSRS